MAKVTRFSKHALSKKEGIVRAPGGGEPIPKGEKWTDEEREEDAPRSEDGKFATKASVGEETEYPEHAWRGTYEKGHALNPEKGKLSEAQKKRIWENEVKTDPDYAREAVKVLYAQKKVRKGTKFAVDGKIFIASIDMTIDEFRDSIRKYWKGEKGEGNLGLLDTALVAKSGGRTKAELAALERAEDSGNDVDSLQVVTNEKGKAELAKIDGKRMKSRMREAAKKAKELRESGYPGNNPFTFVQRKELARKGSEGETHFWPDSDHNDKYVMESLQSGNMGVLKPHRHQIESASSRLGIPAEEIVEMLKSGDIGLSDVKGFKRGE